MSFSNSFPRFYCKECNTEIVSVFDIAPEKKMGWACKCTTAWTGLDKIPLHIDEEKVEKAGALGEEFAKAFIKREEEDLLKVFTKDD